MFVLKPFLIFADMRVLSLKKRLKSLTILWQGFPIIKDYALWQELKLFETFIISLQRVKAFKQQEEESLNTYFLIEEEFCDNVLMCWK